MMHSLLPSIVVLSAAILAAILLALSRPSPLSRLAERLTASHALALTTGLQLIHVVEKAATGSPERISGLLHVPGTSFDFFLLFNFSWIGIWLISVFAIRMSSTMAFFAAWFLAITGIFNGFALPLQAIAHSHYLPGLISAPFVAVGCTLLWTRLRRATVQLRARNIL